MLRMMHILICFRGIIKQAEFPERYQHKMLLLFELLIYSHGTGAFLIEINARRPKMDSIKFFKNFFSGVQKHPDSPFCFLVHEFQKQSDAQCRECPEPCIYHGWNKILLK